MRFDSQLEELRKKFTLDLPARFQEIQNLYHDQVAHNGDPSLLRQALHRLSGLAGTFKAQRISELARNLETHYAQELAHPENQKIVALLFARLEQTIQRYLAEEIPRNKPYVIDAMPGESDKVICVVDPDCTQTERIACILEENGYQVISLHNLHSLSELLDRNGALPSVIIMAAALSNPADFEQPTLQQLKSSSKNFPPLIFLSEHTDTLSRLQAVRAGANDYLEKSVGAELLLDTVAKYLNTTSSQRILIVDDDAICAEYIAHIIQSAGYQSQILTEPLRIFEVLESFGPDLLILDIYMPDCSGIELAKAIRQCCCHNMMPIMFLTTGTDIDQELCALGSGGDEFIRKTDPDHYLLEKLSYRLRRLNQIRALHEQLKNAQQRSERLRKSQSDFLAYVVHELKSPLNVILGFSELLQMDNLLNPEQSEMVNEIVRGGHTQLAMIEELSEQVKIATGRLTLNIEHFNLLPLINQAITHAALLGSESGISVQGRFDPQQVIPVHADRRRVEQILTNLLSNAIKYNQPAGKVWVDIQKRSNGMLRVLVQDTGMGIAHEDREAVFEAFERLNANHKGVEGIGIGLSICSQLIKLMHGRIGVDSQLHVGSQFWIELPLSSD